MVKPSSSGDSADVLIPGVPDDLAMLCLIRVARRHHHILRGVCRRWRSFASSELWVSLRAKHGLAEGWVHVLSRDAAESLHWHAFDPRARQWMKLPPVPSAWSRRFGMSCAALDQRLYVIGGCSKLEATSEVHVFDALRHRWEAAASMACARCFLASAALGGKLYAVGGTGAVPGSPASWELYDPRAGRWEAREDRNIVQDVGESMVMDGKIHVRHVSAPHGLSFYASALDPEQGKWVLVDDEMTSTWRGPAVAAGKDVYMLDQAFGISLMVLDRAHGSWDRVGRISPQSIAPPCRMAAVGPTLLIVGKGLRALLLDTEQMAKVPGLLVTTSVAGSEPLRDNVVMSCNTVYV